MSFLHRRDPVGAAHGDRHDTPGRVITGATGWRRAGRGRAGGS
ncbi:hypothetical protein ACFPM0_07030 [Pseudonocardia sulfidoxydans]